MVVRILFTLWFLLFGATSVLAASGYQMVFETDDTVVGLMVYYDDSAVSYAPLINRYLGSLIASGDMRVLSTSQPSVDDLLRRAQAVMEQGPASQGWDLCVGTVVYRGFEQGAPVLRLDFYLLGYPQESPLFYLGSLTISETAMNMFSSSL